MCLFIETLRIEDGKVWHASLHDRRMNDTRRAFFGPVPDSTCVTTSVRKPIPHAPVAA